MYYNVSQKIFINKSKNLWKNIVQIYLKKINTLHKNTNLYYSCINNKIEFLNELIEKMLMKYLLKKFTKLWNQYLNKILFTYHIYIHFTTQFSSFYLIYEKYLQLLENEN